MTKKPIPQPASKSKRKSAKPRTTTKILRRRGQKLSLNQQRFLKAFVATGTITGAARQSKLNRRNHFDWSKHDEVYQQAFADAHQEVCDLLEQELIRRATKGWQEPIYYQGEKVGSVIRYSDACLIFALKGHLPEKYLERVHQTGVVGPGPISITIQQHLDSLEENEEYREFLEWRRCQAVSRGAGTDMQRRILAAGPALVCPRPHDHESNPGVSSGD